MCQPRIRGPSDDIAAYFGITCRRLQASERERYGKQLKWTKLLYNKLYSPKWKYRFEVLSYTVLILLFVVVSIWPIKIDLSYPELLLSLFMIALVFDEVRYGTFLLLISHIQLRETTQTHQHALFLRASGHRMLTGASNLRCDGHVLPSQVRQLIAPIFFDDRKLTNQLWEHVSDGWNNIDLALFIVYGLAIGIRMTTGPDACVTSHVSQLPPTHYVAITIIPFCSR